MAEPSSITRMLELFDRALTYGLFTEDSAIVPSMRVSKSRDGLRTVDFDGCTIDAASAFQHAVARAGIADRISMTKLPRSVALAWSVLEPPGLGFSYAMNLDGDWFEPVVNIRSTQDFTDPDVARLDAGLDAWLSLVAVGAFPNPPFDDVSVLVEGHRSYLVSPQVYECSIWGFMAGADSLRPLIRFVRAFHAMQTPVYSLEIS